MRKHLWILAVPLILTISLTGCNIIPGAQGEAQTESAQRLDPTAWPTPQPSPSQASPTPFPKTTLAPTATPTPRPTVTSEASASSSTATTGGELTFTGDIGDLVRQVTELSGGFPPVAAAAIKTNNATIRQGPGASYDSLGVAQVGELAALLGKDDTGDWQYVLTRSGLQGWLPSEQLQITFSLGVAPVLPPDPPAQKPAQADSSAPVVADFLGGLEPVAVAFVTADSVTIRQGPGASYPPEGVVEQGELAGVLGTNAASDWLYVVTISVVQGWVPADTMRVTGSLAGAPVLPANPLAANIPQTTGSSPTATSPAGSLPLALTDLAPVTMARVDNDALNVRQGPGGAYELLGTLSRGKEVTVLALNKTGEWALVKTAEGEFGWASLDYLAVDGSLAGAPQVISPSPNRDLTPGQVAPIFPSSAAESKTIETSGNTGSSQPASITAPPVEQVSISNSAASTPDLSPVATASANRADVDLYRGPALTYEPIVTLSLDETVSVLALNQDGNWALVQPADAYKSPGWLTLAELDVDGSLATAPQAITAWVDSNELAVRSGPGLFHERIGTLTINDLVVVLGLNQGRNWALVKPITGGGQGWISTNFLTLTGAWNDVPLAPALPLATADTAAGQSEAASANAVTGATNLSKLVFQTSSGGDIMIVNPDGTALLRLTHGIDPVLSPDGQTVAFTRWTGEDGALWLINVDGSNERPVLGETKQAKHPAWSPDGQQIVVNFQHEGRLDSKRTCDNLIELGDKDPKIPWNVDFDSVEVEIRSEGTPPNEFGVPYLCWTLPPDPHWGLRVVDVDDGAYEDVPSDAYAYGPEWDPANSWRIASSGLNGLVQLDVNRAQQWALTDKGEDHTPVFSPDGRHIAVAFKNNGRYDIHRLNSDGSGRTILTNTPLWVTAEPGDNKPWNNVSPTWSPDGSQIAFLTDRTGRWEIWLMGADGSNQRPMFSDEVNDQFPIDYDFVDERVLSWR